ncbi:hypothetical protein Tco_0708622 [Tanacetum coccineum]
MITECGLEFDDRDHEFFLYLLGDEFHISLINFCQFRYSVASKEIYVGSYLLSQSLVILSMCLWSSSAKEGFLLDNLGYPKFALVRRLIANFRKFLPISRWLEVGLG